MVVTGETNEEFLRFDVVADDSDHYFLNNNKPQKDGGNKDCFTNSSSEVYKSIMKGREILKKNLPENMAIRVYEKRVDLLRAVIVGAAGTACHDGLFFFDFVFPTDYPLRRPKFCFRSFEANARSFYVTVPDSWWGGKEHKKWNPSKSTILQLLVKLQNQLPDWILTSQIRRVLNDNKPLVLEKSFVANNGDVFVASCQRMLVLVQNPPKNFEAFVAQHFRKHGNVVLKACEAYKNGDVQVGNYRDDEEDCDGYLSPTNNNNNNNNNNPVIIKVSGAFKASIEKLYPQLFTAFMELNTKTISSEPLAAATQVTKKLKHGITNKIIGTLMKICGLNKNVNAMA